MANSRLNATPLAIRGYRFTVMIPYLDADGDPIDPTTPDTEISLDGGVTFADCTNEVTTGGGNGVGFISLTVDETLANVLVIAAKSANAKTTILIVQTHILVYSGPSLTVTAAPTTFECSVSPSEFDAQFGSGFRPEGLWIAAEDQARMVQDYNSSTGAITIYPGLETIFTADVTEVLFGFPLGTGPIRQYLGIPGGSVR